MAPFVGVPTLCASCRLTCGGGLSGGSLGCSTPALFTWTLTWLAPSDGVVVYFVVDVLEVVELHWDVAESPPGLRQGVAARLRQGR